jgi:outer membrane protein
MKKYLAFLLIVVWEAKAYSQTLQATNDTIKWTFQECLDYALEHNLTIQNAHLNKQTSEANYAKTVGQRLPNLTFNASQKLNQGTTIDPITSVFTAQTFHTTSSGFNSQLSLYNGNQLNNRISQSELLVEQNELYIAEAKNSIALSVLEAYVQVLYNKESLQKEENNQEISKKNLDWITEKFDRGALTILDVSNAQVQFSNASFSVLQAKNNYQKQLLILKQLLEIPANQNFDIIELDQEINNNKIPDKFYVYENALDKLPEIASSKLQIEINSKDLLIARGAYLPTLSLSGGLNSGYTSSRPIDFNSQYRSNFSTQIGLNLSVPIFDRFQTKYTIKNAELNIEKAKNNVSIAQKATYQKVESAWQSAVMAQGQTENASNAKEAAKLSYELGQKKYAQGAASISDLMISQNNYLNAEQSYLQAKYLEILYIKLLDFYEGNEIKL